MSQFPKKRVEYPFKCQSDSLFLFNWAVVVKMDLAMWDCAWGNHSLFIYLFWQSSKEIASS